VDLVLAGSARTRCVVQLPHPSALVASAPVGVTHVAAVPGTPAACVEASSTFLFCNTFLFCDTFKLPVSGGFLVRISVLIGASRGCTGPFFLPPWPWWVPGWGDHPPSGVVGAAAAEAATKADSAVT
jgi:hypothetical protein